MARLAREARQAIRSLGRVPTMSLAAIFCIALGIGATTSIYAAVHTALLRPLPFPESDRLVTVYRTTPHFQTGPFSPANFLDLRRETESLQALAAVTGGVALLQDQDGTARVSVNTVSGDFFSLLGTRTVLGRVLRPEDEAADGPATALISDELWRERFGADPTLVGRTIRLDGDETEVVGVLPRDFSVPHGSQVFAAQVWTPLRFTPEQASFRRSNYLMLMGRLAAGRTVESAHEELRGVMSRIIEANPVLEGEQLQVVPMRAESARAVRGPLLLLLGAVGFVLLIAAANVASLLLARGVARRREWAVRTALGAGHADILRAAGTESLLVTGTGAFLGLLFAWVGVRLIRGLVPSGLPQLEAIAIAPSVLGAALLLALVVGLLAGIAPAWQARRAQPRQALQGDRRSGAGRSHHRFLRSLVAVEVALSLILLIGAGLVVRGFRSLTDQDPGFDPDPLLTLTVDISPGNYQDRSIDVAFLSPALDAIRAVPGVEAAGAISLIPYENWGWNFNIRYEGRPDDDPTRLPLVETRIATPGLFDALEMTLVRGRLFQPSDAAEDARAVVVANQALADRDFPGEDPVGKRFRTSDTTFATIVGVVNDIRNFGPDRDPRPEVYWSYLQGTGRTSFPIVVRGSRDDPAALAASVRDAILGVDPDAAVSRIRPMSEVIATSVGRPRFYLVLMTVFAGVALLLAMAGLYGVMSYAVAQQTREIGIRSALGSTPAASLGLVLRRGLRLVALGAAVGLAGSLGLTRFLEGMLHGISPLDPVTWLAIPALLAAAAVLAVLLPARRAASVDPMVAIRTE